PTILSVLKPDAVPGWDGDKETAIDYLWSVYELANGGGTLRRAVGYWLWFKFEKGSAIHHWYMTLSPEQKADMRRDAYVFLDVIKRDYLGEPWIQDITTEFRLQTFRDHRHRTESPSAFLHRRILYARSLDLAPVNSPAEISLILRAAPMEWSIILVPSTIPSTDALKARVIQFEKQLL
ncbi:uncharacterized protein SCHCODRAFT_01052346, partial [Schizophyllum commune H4-8]|uniref:uncharacterized protein n=1 Tax=Schizophyllum commune (strain H4-8 / FGSC 9210) TaxID=578458 RepID=UPI00215F9D2B